MHHVRRLLPRPGLAKQVLSSSFAPCSASSRISLVKFPSATMRNYSLSLDSRLGDRIANASAMGKWQEAKSIIDDAEKAGTTFPLETYEIVLDCMFRSNQYHAGSQFYQAISSRFPALSVKTYTILINATRKIGDIKKAYEIFTDMRSKGIAPDAHAYSIMINTFCTSPDRRHFETACELWTEVNAKMRPNIVLYNIFLAGTLKHKGLAAAEEFFSVIKADKHVRSDKGTYTIMIDAYAKAGKLKEAVYCFKEMQTEGNVLPNFKTFTALMSAYLQKDRLDDALYIFTKMKESRSTAPTVYTYTTLIEYAAQVGKLDLAANLLKDMMASGIELSVITHNVLMRALSERGKLEFAEELLNTMKAKNVKPDHVTFLYLCKGYLGQGMTDKVIEIPKRMASYGLTPSFEIRKIINDINKESEKTPKQDYQAKYNSNTTKKRHLPYYHVPSE